MKLLARSHPHPPPALRDDEEALIDAVNRWAAAERRIHGRNPIFPARIATVAGEVVVRCDARVVDCDDEDDATILRFRMIELT